jgi:hypothetical protein
MNIHFTEYAGIDYSLGRSNIDDKTGMRYGVIPANEILQAWTDDSEPEYFYTCPNCGYEFGFDYPLDENCPQCKEPFDDYNPWDLLEPSGWTYSDNEYELHQDGDNPDIWVLKSPYYSYSQFCSPCAPGAGYLLAPLKDQTPENRTLCLGPDWFEDEKPPYPIFEIKTGKRIYPEE